MADEARLVAPALAALGQRPAFSLTPRDARSAVEMIASDLTLLVIGFSIAIALFVVVFTVVVIGRAASGDGVILRHSKTGNTAQLRAAAQAEPQPAEQAEPGRECWICFTEGDESAPLVRGCACRGSAGWVHVKCVVTAAKHTPAMWSVCPSCKQRYTGKLLLELAQLRWAEVRDMHPVAPARLEAANTLCIALHGCGEPGQAAAVVESTLTACEAELGQDHPQTLTALNNVAQACQASGDLVKATGLAERAVAGYRRTLGSDNQNTLQAINNLGGLHVVKGSLDEAAPLLEEALVGFRKVLGEGHKCTINAVHNLAGLRAERGDFDGAIELLRCDTPPRLLMRK
jgi:hypothetical protein